MIVMDSHNKNQNEDGDLVRMEQEEEAGSFAIRGQESYMLDFEKLREAPPAARWNLMMDLFEMLGIVFTLPLDNARSQELVEKFQTKGMLKNVNNGA